MKTFTLESETMVAIFQIDGEVATITHRSHGRHGPKGAYFIGPDVKTVTVAEARAEYRKLMQGCYLPANSKVDLRG